MRDVTDTGTGTEAYLRLLENWIKGADPYLYDCPDRPELACYGTGDNTWGVQTNQKALAAYAMVATDDRFDEARVGRSRESVLDTALRLLRFSLHTHIEGTYTCTDGTSWGHTWISVLGVERMMHAVEALEPHLSEDDRSLLRRVLVSESDWLLDHYPIVAGLYNKDGNNRPESNLWNGALLHRTAMMYPDEPRADAYREKGSEFLINSISIPADAEDRAVVDGKAVAERHIGANFFPSYALNHHGYLNVGYMVICLSNMAMLHFAYRRRGLTAPQSLYHHGRELWDLVKACTFPDGRLLRIGGDSRVRYTYCQDYVIPVWHMMLDMDGDESVLGLERGWLAQIESEMDASRDGTFLSYRCRALQEHSPLYFSRLEADRAAALSMGLAWRELAVAGAAEAKLQQRADASEGAASTVAELAAAASVSASPSGRFAGAIATEAGGTGNVGETMRPEERPKSPGGSGGTDDSADANEEMLRFGTNGDVSWRDAYHGAYLQRSGRRIASWVWDASEKPQGLCLPAEGSDMAEWRENMAGRLEGYGRLTMQTLEAHDGRRFEGGFLTWGSTLVHSRTLMAEGQKDAQLARNLFVCAALPDDEQMIVLHRAVALRQRTAFKSIEGLNLLIPNDVFNDNHRLYYDRSGKWPVHGYGSPKEAIRTGSRWINVDNKLGVVALYGSDEIVIRRPGERQIGMNDSPKTFGLERTLYADQICGPYLADGGNYAAGDVILDTGYVMQAGADRERTSRSAGCELPLAAEVGKNGVVRAVQVIGADGQSYVLIANFGEERVVVTLPEAGEWSDIAAGTRFAPLADGTVLLEVEPESARLLVAERPFCLDC